MVQIVSARKTANGTYIIEVKPLTKERVSETGKTIQVAGTNGWAETLPGVFHEADGEQHPLTAVIQIRRKRKS